MRAAATLAVFLVLAAAAHAQDVRPPCTTDRTTNCYTQTVSATSTANPYPGSDYAKDHTDYFKAGGVVGQGAGNSNNPWFMAGFYYNGGTQTSIPSGGYYAATMDKRGQLRISETGSDDPLVGITPVVAQSGTSLVGKSSQGNLYGGYAVLGAAASAQTYLVAINAAAAPASGAAITPLDVAVFPSNAVGAQAALNYGAGPPNGYSAGIVLLVTTSLTTYTPGAASFVQARVR